MGAKSGNGLSYRGIPKWNIGTIVQTGSIINMTFLGEWNEVLPREGCLTKGGECEGYGPPLSATTFSPTWDLVAAP